MGKISELLKRIRNWIIFYEKEVIFGTVIFLTASLSFGLGYLSNREFNHAPIIIEKCSQ